jgi:hypothetical protein
MVKRRVESQTSSLTPDHKKLGISPIPACAGGVRYTVKKLLRRATSFLQTSSQSKVEIRSYECPKPWDGIISRLHFGSPGEKVPFGWKCDGETQIILYGGRWWFPPSLGCGESNESKVAHGLSQHQECSECELTNLLVGFGCKTK